MATAQESREAKAATSKANAELCAALESGMPEAAIRTAAKALASAVSAQEAVFGRGAAMFEGISPFVSAMQARSGIQTALLLVESGLSPDLNAAGEARPLAWALLEGRRDWVSELLRLGADPQAAGFGGIDAMMCASALGDKAAMAELAPSCDEPWRVDDFGWSAFDWAASAGEAEYLSSCFAYHHARGAGVLSGKIALRDINEAAGPARIARADYASDLAFAAARGNWVLTRAVLPLASKTDMANAARASIESHFEAGLEIILERLGESDVEVFEESLLCFACRLGRAEAVRLLLEHGDDPELADKSGRKPLYLAAASGHRNIMELLLGAGASPESGDPRKLARELWADAVDGFESDKEAFLDALLSHYGPKAKSAEPGEDAEPALLKNVRERFERARPHFEALGAIPEVGWREEALFQSLYKGKSSAAVAKALLDGPSLSAAIHNGSSEFMIDALSIAANKGDKKLVMMLLEAGADPCGAPQCRHTPLSMGCASLEVVKLLVEAGADVNGYEQGGSLPLTNGLAAASKFTEGFAVLEYLLESGADPNRRSRGKPCAAAARGKPALDLLERHGAEFATCEHGSSGLAYGWTLGDGVAGKTVASLMQNGMGYPGTGLSQDLAQEFATKQKASLARAEAALIKASANADGASSPEIAKKSAARL